MYLKGLVKYPEYLSHQISYKIRSQFRYAWLINDPKNDDRLPPPLVCKLYLNQACDLRCPMCFLWGETGVYTSADKRPVPQELDWSIVQKIFLEIGRYQPTFILSGGEPLLYSHFRDLAALLKKYRTCAYINTNGNHIDKHLEDIEDNPYLVFYVSLDGTKLVNDKLRGEGVYDKVVSNIRKLKSLRTRHYVGIQFTLMPENAGVLYDTCKEAVDLGVDWVLINLRWNLSKEQGTAYEEQLLKDFGVKAWSHKGYVTPSYPVDIKEFIEQYNRVKRARWPIGVSSYLKKPQDLERYIHEGYKNPYNNFCYKQWVRMDVLSTGEVTPCTPYPDLTFGSLKTKSVNDIWNGEAYKKFRQYRRKKVLAVCSKCDCLYLYNKGRVLL